MIWMETDADAPQPKGAKSKKPRPNRIRELCRPRNLTYSDLGRLLDPPAHEVTIAKLATGKQRLTQEWMNKLAAALKVTPAEIIQAAGSGLRSVTVGTVVEAGKWHFKNERQFETFDISIPDDPNLRDVTLYAAVMRGDSMNQRYRNGSIIVFSPITGTSPSEIREGSRYHVRKAQAGADAVEETVQTLRKDTAGQWWLVPESNSPDFQQWTKLEGHHQGYTINLIGRVRYALVPED
jgi:hypothetical protein